MLKEQRHAKKCAEQARLKKERMMGQEGAKPLSRTASEPSHPSCAINYLDQTMGLVRNPHGEKVGLLRDKDTKHEELLLHGVSHEGEGKKAYLKYKTAATGPHERYGRAVT